MVLWTRKCSNMLGKKSGFMMHSLRKLYKNAAKSESNKIHLFYIIYTFNLISYTNLMKTEKPFDINSIELNPHISINPYLYIIMSKSYARVQPIPNFRKINNRLADSYNGNKKNVNFLHWNKGNSLFKNKSEEIKILCKQHRPDIFSICEANLQHKSDIIKVEFPDFNHEVTKMSKQVDFSRSILLINKNIIYKWRGDLEANDTSTIWVEIKLPQHKPFLVMGGYRQWRTPAKMGIKNSVSTKIKLGDIGSSLKIGQGLVWKGKT